MEMSIIFIIFVLILINILYMTDEEVKLKTFNYYSNNTCKCNRCGFSDIRALCLDHVNGDGNTHRKNGGKKGINLYRSLCKHNFVSDYDFQVLCSNCNMIKFFENKESKHIKSDEWKNKISDSLKGRIMPIGKFSYRAVKVAQYDLNLNLIKIWDVIREAESFYNDKKTSTNISSCCRNYQKTAYGFVWKYYNN